MGTGVEKERLGSYQAVVFDYYNTIVLDDVMVPQVWEHLNALGYDSSYELQAMFEPDAFDGSTTPHLEGEPNHDTWCLNNWRQLLRLSAVPEEELESVLQIILEKQAKYSSKPAPMAHDLIEMLKKANFKIGLCSNWESPIESSLENAGIDPRIFDAITTSAEVGARKPHGLIYQNICEKLNVSPCNSIFIGDNWETDITGALRSGMWPIWIRSGQPSKGIFRVVSEFESLTELSFWFKELVNGHNRNGGSNS